MKTKADEVPYEGYLADLVFLHKYCSKVVETLVGHEHMYFAEELLDKSRRTLRLYGEERLIDENVNVPIEYAYFDGVASRLKRAHKSFFTTTNRLYFQHKTAFAMISLMKYDLRRMEKRNG